MVLCGVVGMGWGDKNVLVFEITPLDPCIATLVIGKVNQACIVLQISFLNFASYNFVNTGVNCFFKDHI